MLSFLSIFEFCSSSRHIVCAAVRVNLTSASIAVDENDPGSVVCVALEGALAQNVSATVMIGPKDDATDPATGD